LDSVVIVGTVSAAGNVRIVRGNLLDILGQPYVQTARAKGQTERIVVYRHARMSSAAARDNVLPSPGR
jgi:peptide/nickel transport system permease protein